MKIIIKDANGQIAVNIEAENETGVSKSQVWATLSLALASMVAEDARKKDMPPALKKLMIDTTAEMVAAAVKNDFLKVANSGTHGVSFYNKEAEFMRKGLTYDRAKRKGLPVRQHGQAQREHGQFSPLRVYHRLRLSAICGCALLRSG